MRSPIDLRRSWNYWISDIYCAATGEFLGENPELRRQPELVDSDPYDRGWLYLVRGRSGEDALDVHGYIGLLQATIEKMLAEQTARENGQC